MNNLLLIAENEDGAYLPLGIFTPTEALEAAKADQDSRSSDRDDVCITSYALWKRDESGRYVLTARLDAAGKEVA
jgi:hypothetical protein